MTARATRVGHDGPERRKEESQDQDGADFPREVEQREAVKAFGRPSRSLGVCLQRGTPSVVLLLLDVNVAVRLGRRAASRL